MTSVTEASSVLSPPAPSTYPPPSGLSTVEAKERLATQGPNELARAEATSLWLLLLGQFKSPVVWLLHGACVVSAALGEVVDAIAIGTIVVLNSLVGFFQEYRAERAVLALRSMTGPPRAGAPRWPHGGDRSRRGRPGRPIGARGG
jgi:Ca2+-transporting ATPase